MSVTQFMRERSLLSLVSTRVSLSRCDVCECVSLTRSCVSLSLTLISVVCVSCDCVCSSLEHHTCTSVHTVTLTLRERESAGGARRTAQVPTHRARALALV